MKVHLPYHKMTAPLSVRPLFKFGFIVAGEGAVTCNTCYSNLMQKLQFKARPYIYEVMCSWICIKRSAIPLRKYCLDVSACLGGSHGAFPSPCKEKGAVNKDADMVHWGFGL